MNTTIKNKIEIEEYNYTEFKQTIIDKLLHRKEVVFVDLFENNEYRLLSKILEDSVEEYRYETFEHPDIEGARLVYMHIQADKFDKILEKIKKFPDSLEQKDKDKYSIAIKQFKELNDISLIAQEI